MISVSKASFIYLFIFYYCSRKSVREKKKKRMTTEIAYINVYIQFYEKKIKVNTFIDLVITFEKV